MKISKQEVELLNCLSYEDMLKNIEIAGRTCYKSESEFTKESGEKFVKKLIKLGHESVLEHGSLTFKIKTNRNITHELVRHRIASYSQESTRYVKYDDIEFIPWIDPRGLKVNHVYDLEDLYVDLEFLYGKLIEDNFKPEEARDILPGSVATTIIVTMNMRELRHFLKLRLSKAAHPQMRDLAKMIQDIVKENYPVFIGEL
ncbi:FAD-dependent thymidylate synthase [Peptoniphilus harei]|uniref:FAD-dependent thymidylate synthase n=1 Tax=Peptoniphilus harei TaxID=54005 RepID=UPI0011DD5629|nr:FAD-dependent thymidylate synthase [Peptoniphilus harei]